MNMKGVADNAPTPAIRPFIDGTFFSRASERYPPSTEAGRPPPTMMKAPAKEYCVECSGHLCSKKLAVRNPRE